MSFKTDPRLLVCAALVAVCAGMPSHAAEDEETTRDTSAIGVAAGVLPPPGVYGSVQAVRSGLAVKDGEGGDRAVKVRSNAVDAGVLWVPPVKLFGAAYGVGFYQPLREQGVTTPRGSQDAAGFANTALNLSTLSWDLGRGLHASLGATLFVDDVDSTSGQSLGVGRAFTTFEPRAAVTALSGAWTMTASLLLDANTTNRDSRYRSGNDVVLDLTALRRVGRWELGLGAEILRQVSDDRRSGVVVPAVVDGHGRGNRARNASLGPVVGYDFGRFALQAYYQRSVAAANVAAGYAVGLRASFPFSAGAAGKP